MTTTTATFDDLIGIPFRRGGRDREGMDCLGVVHEGLLRLGIPVFDVWPIWRDAYVKGWRDYEKAIPEGWVDVTGEDAQAGDVWLTRERGVPQHVLLVVSASRALSSTERTGVVLEPLTRYRRALQSAWRHETCR